MEDIPWSDVRPGAILLCVTPQVAKEIDKRKSDSRLGKKARQFNRIIRPFLQHQKPINVCTCPQVDLAYIKPGNVRWDNHPDLTPDDPDSVVVAQTLYADLTEANEIIFISHDINPIALAYSVNLNVLEMPDRWLRDKQPSPEDKEKQRMKARIRELEATEPSFDLSINAMAHQGASIPVYDVAPLSEDEKSLVFETLAGQAKRKTQTNSHTGLSLLPHDLGYEDRIKDYISSELPRFVDNMHYLTQLFFNQIPFTLVVKNSGSIHGSDVIIQVTCESARLHDKYALFPYLGPTPPKPRNPLQIPEVNFPNRYRRRDRNEVELTISPEMGSFFELMCDDFRQQRLWSRTGVIIPHGTNDQIVQIEANLTASNLTGSINAAERIPLTYREVQVRDLVDLETLQPIVDAHISEGLSKLLDEKNIDCIDIFDLKDAMDI